MGAVQATQRRWLRCCRPLPNLIVASLYGADAELKPFGEVHGSEGGLSGYGVHLLVDWTLIVYAGR